MDHTAAGYAASTLLFGEQSISEVDAHTPTSAIPVQDHALDLDTTQVYDLDLALVKGSCFFWGIKALFHHLFHVAPPIQLLQILHPIPKAESKWKTSERVPRYARMREGIQLRRIHGGSRKEGGNIMASNQTAEFLYRDLQLQYSVSLLVRRTGADGLDQGWCARGPGRNDVGALEGTHGRRSQRTPSPIAT